MPTLISPDDLANLGLWLRSDRGLYTDAGTTPVSSDGDAVYQWNDYSGNNRHYSQSTSGNRPLWKVNRLNGYPGILFDATDDYMTSGWGPSEPYTIIVIYARRGTSSYQRALNGTNNWLIGPTSSFETFYNGAYASNTSHVNVLDTFYMVTARANSSGRDFHVDRVGHVQNGSPGSTGPGNLIVGGGGGGFANNPFNGDIVELIVYTDVKTRKELCQLEDYVAFRYGIFPRYNLLNGVLGLIGFWSAHTGVTLVSGAVSQWDDQSGWGNHLTQGTSGNRPTIASADLNSADTMVFQNKWLSFPTAMFGSFAWYEAHIYALLKTDADPNADPNKTGLWQLGNSGNSTHYPWTDNSVYEEVLSNVRYNTGNPSPDLSTDWRLYSVSRTRPGFGSGTYRTAFDGTTHYNPSNSDYVAWNGSPLFGKSVAGHQFYGKAALIAIFNQPLDSTDDAAIQAALQKSAYPYTASLTPTPPPSLQFARYY